MSVYYPSLGVSVKVPSHKYGGKLEGLCGDCDNNPMNDMLSPSGKDLKDNVNEFGLSWLYKDFPGQVKESCSLAPPETCVPIPEGIEPCKQLLNTDVFGVVSSLLNHILY